MKIVYQVMSSAVGVMLCLVGWIWRRLSTRPHVVVLGYHSVSNLRSHIAMPEADFARQMAWLYRSRVPALSLPELKSFLDGTLTLKRDGVVITFDDGFADNFITAGPALERFGFRGIFFIPTGLTGQPYTWDGDLSSPELRVMTWKEIEGLACRSHEIGSHLVTHRSLSALSEEEIECELRESKEAIARHVGRPPEAVAFPYGDCGRGKDATALASAADYRMAFTTRPDTSGRPRQHPLSIPRYMVDRFSGRDPFTTFVLFLTCLYGTFQWYDRAARILRRISRSLPGNVSGGSS